MASSVMSIPSKQQNSAKQNCVTLKDFVKSKLCMAANNKT